MTVFYISMTVVALIWAIVLIRTAFNVYAAITNRGADDEDADQDETTAIPDATSTIAGMPAQTYYANQVNQYRTPDGILIHY